MLYIFIKGRYACSKEITYCNIHNTNNTEKKRGPVWCRKYVTDVSFGAVLQIRLQNKLCLVECFPIFFYMA